MDYITEMLGAISLPKNLPFSLPKNLPFSLSKGQAYTAALAVALSIVAIRRRRQNRRITASGRCVLITGCDSGFGKQLTFAALEQGFDVVAACYTQEGAARLAETKAKTIVADLTTPEGRQKVVAAAQTAAGQRGLFCLVNNAGLCLPGNVDWLPPSAYEATMNLNFHAPVALTYELLPALKAARGRVINITSVDGFIALPTNPAYNASKHALEAYSDTLRCEMLPWGVKVVVIEPATMRTPMSMAFADGWLKSYRAAPMSRQRQYGDAWANNMHAKTKKGIQQIAADPAETVSALVMAMCLVDPPSRMTTGKAASFLFKPLSHLPDATRDKVLYAMTFGSALPLPLGLMAKPPPGVVSHVTVHVRDLALSTTFYCKFGLKALGGPVEGQQFLQPGVTRKWTQPMVLLHEDKAMPPRGETSDAGMTRLCLYTTDIKADAQRLANLGLESIAPMAHHKMAAIIAYTDPDGFVVYLIQFYFPVGLFARGLRWYNRISDPMLLHWTVNVTDAEAGNAAFEALGFKSVSDQNRDQVLYDLLPAFAKNPKTTVIEHIRLAKLPADSHFMATIMQWVNPKTERKGAELLNSITLSVEDVEVQLRRAKEAGLATLPAQRRCLPVFGEVLVGTAFVDGPGTRVEFISF